MKQVKKQFRRKQKAFSESTLRLGRRPAEGKEKRESLSRGTRVQFQYKKYQSSNHNECVFTNWIISSIYPNAMQTTVSAAP